MFSIFIASFTLFMIGCVSNDFYVQESIDVITNKDFEVVGSGLAIDSHFSVAPDHLIRAYDRLFVQGDLVQVVGRFSDSDIFFYRNTTGKGFDRVFSSRNIQEGMILENRIKEEFVVLSSEALFHIGSYQIHPVLELEGIIEKGDSGSPLFDRSGKLVGMFIGADLVKETSYAVSGDLILELMEKLEVGTGN